MSNGRTRKSALNIGANMLNQIIVLVLAFVSRKVFLMYLDISYLGINSLFSDVLMLLSMADLGFGVAMVYSFYKPLAENNQEKLCALVTFYKHVYTIIAILVSVVGVAILPLLPYIIKLEEPIPHLNLYYLIALANVVVSYLCVHKTTLLTADQKNYILTRISIALDVIKTASQILSLIFFHNYIIYLLIGVVTNLTKNIIGSYKAQRVYPFLRNREELPTEEKKSILKNAFASFIYRVSTILLSGTDNIIISVLLGTTCVGLYSNYLMTQNKMAIFYGLFFSSLTASIGNLIASEEAKKRYEIFNCEQSLSYIISGIVTPCYVLLINSFIQLWIGIEYVLDFKTVMIMGLNMYLGCVMQPLWSYRDATGMFQKTKWTMLICAVFNIILSVFMGKIMGLNGVLIASVISRVLTYIWYEPVVLFREYFGKKSTGYFASLLVNLFFVFVLVFTGQYILSFLLIEDFAQWILVGSIIFAFCTIIMFAIYSRTSGFQMVLKKIKSLDLRH